MSLANDHRPRIPLPRERLRPAHWRERPLRPIHVVTRERIDTSFTYGMPHRRVRISLAKVPGFFEEDEKSDA